MHLGGRVAYQLHSLGAAGVPATNPDVAAAQPSGRGLEGMADWLDRVADLGCGAVLLTPIFVASTHGYDTVDPFRIDQRLGDDDDFAAFAEACHHRDLVLVLDGVFNHVGRDFPRFREVLAQGPGVAAEAAGWFRIDPDGDDGQGGSGDGFAYHCFEGHRELPSLNHRSPAVLDWAADVCNHWLGRGADGWRLDAAYAIPPDFVAQLVQRVRAAGHADALLFGEVIHGDYAAFVEATGLDAVTQYELHKALWSSFNDANLFELSWSLDRHRGFCERFAPVTFVGNHDVTRIRSHLDEPAHVGPVVAALMTLPGRPCVYYGDELGWEGVKEDRAGGDDAIRPALPPADQPVSDEAAGVLDLHRSLVALRSARPWLQDGQLEVESTANRRLTYTVTSASSPAAVHVTVEVGTDVPAAPDGWGPIATGPGYAIAERP
jgi:glycosidase